MVLGSHWSSPLLRETTYTSYTYNYLLPRQFLLRHTIKFGNEKHPGSQFAKWLPIPPYVSGYPGSIEKWFWVLIVPLLIRWETVTMLHLQICHFAEDKISCTIPTVQAIPWYDTYLYFCLYFLSPPILTKFGRGKITTGPFHEFTQKSCHQQSENNKPTLINFYIVQRRAEWLITSEPKRTCWTL